MNNIKENEISRMPSKRIKGSLSGIVDKINETYGEFISGFSPGVGRRIVPVMIDGEVLGWKMQCYENDAWVDMDETPFETMKELIAYYKSED